MEVPRFALTLSEAIREASAVEPSFSERGTAPLLSFYRARRARFSFRGQTYAVMTAPLDILRLFLLWHLGLTCPERWSLRDEVTAILGDGEDDELSRWSAIEFLLSEKIVLPLTFSGAEEDVRRLVQGKMVRDGV